MENTPLDSPTADGLEFLRFLKRRWKLLGILLVIALTLAGISTAYMPKKYYSWGVIFPVSQSSVESYVDNPSFGGDVDADRLLQILQSGSMRDSIIRMFNLYAYYELDSTKSPDWRDQLEERYNKDIEFSRTQYMSIIISAKTRKPQMSADIVNSIIDMVDRTRERIIKKNFHTAYESLAIEYNAKKKIVDSLARKITEKRHGENSKVIATINTQGFIQIAGDDGSPLSTEIEILLNQFIYEQTRLNDLSAKYEKAKSSIDRPITQVFRVDRARASNKKASPSYFTNLLLAGAATLLFSCIVLLFYEKLQRLRARL